MRRYFRWVCAFALAFGLLGAFSSVVNADDVSLLADTSPFTCEYTKTLSVNNWMTSVVDIQGSHDSRYDRVYLDTGVVPRNFGNSVITDNFNCLDLNDIGYSYETWVEKGTYSSSAYLKTKYTWEQIFTVTGANNYWLNGDDGIYVNGTRASSSSSQQYISIQFAGPQYHAPSLIPGQRYYFVLCISGLNSDIPVILAERDTTSVLGSWVYPQGDYYFVPYVAKDGDDLSKFRLTFKLPLSDSSFDYQLQTMSIVSDSGNDGVEDAIRDQTDDMNQNHQETMDKIDDITDFDEQEQSGMTGQVDDVKGQLDEKLGILSFADTVIGNFIGLFKETSEKPGLVFPGFEIEVDGVSYTVWEDTIFDLSMIDTGFADLMSAVRFATSFLVYAALFMYVQKIFSAIMQDWSDRNG